MHWFNKTWISLLKIESYVHTLQSAFKVNLLQSDYIWPQGISFHTCYMVLKNLRQINLWLPQEKCFNCDYGLTHRHSQQRLPFSISVTVYTDNTVNTIIFFLRHSERLAGQDYLLLSRFHSSKPLITCNHQGRHGSEPIKTQKLS